MFRFLSDDTQVHLLHVACMTGNDSRVERFLRIKPTIVNEPSAEECAPLISAIFYFGTAEVVRLLIRHGSNVNPEGRHSALFTAAMWNKKEIVDILITHGAHVRVSEQVHYYSALGLAAAVEQLISEDSEAIRAREWGDMTPLHAACMHGHREVARILIEAGSHLKLGIAKARLLSMWQFVTAIRTLPCSSWSAAHR